MKTIEKLRITTTLKMGKKVYLEGEIHTFPQIDTELIHEVKMKTRTIEVLSWREEVSQDSGVTSAGETSSVFMDKKDIPEPVVEIEPEVEPEIKSEPEVETESEVEPEVEPEIEPEIETESEVEPEIKSEPEPKLKPKPKPKSKRKTKPKSKIARKTKPKSGLRLRGGV